MVTASVIVPVWNRSDLTHSFLFRNWQLYRGMEEVEFILIDNGSTDNTLAILSSWKDTMGDRLQVQVNYENRGFSAGNNQGVLLASLATKAYIFLSNDVVPIGDYVTPILKVLKIKTLFGAELLSHNTGWNTFEKVIIPYLTGWCIAAERETWLKYLGWDERYYPCDYEDIDLSCSAVENGLHLEAITLPLQHMSGQSAQLLEGGRAEITLKSRAAFMKKWKLND